MRAPPLTMDKEAIKDNSTNQKKIQQKIEEIVGGPVTWGFEGNLEAFRKEDLKKKRWEDIGSVVKQYCAAIRDMLVRDCKDPEIKEEFIKQFYARRIVFRYDENRTIMFPQTKLSEGCLKIIFAPKCFNLGPYYITSEGNALHWIL